jgi:hypothetical protein
MSSGKIRLSLAPAAATLFVATTALSGDIRCGVGDAPMVEMPIGDIQGWKQTFVQDFEHPAEPGQVDEVYGEDMRGYSGFKDTSGSGTYTPDSVLSVSDGVLDYYLHTDGGEPRVACVIPFGYEGQTYGKYSVRLRADNLPGYKIAFLLWPSSGALDEGEIDWPEGNLNGKMSPASVIKGSYSNGGPEFDPPERVYSATDSSGWHVATTEWTPGSVKWYWDDVLVGETTRPEGVPDTNFRWTLQAETELGPDARFPEPETAGHLQVDWVVQYGYAPESE